MLSKRIIPCLDVKNGRTVKGTQFLELRDAGDPVELAALYASAGADELVFLDITATIEKRKTLVELVQKVAMKVNIPFTVGGGVSSVEDVQELLKNGADKVSINTAAFRKPQLVRELSNEFGNQCVVVAIDGRKEEDGEWYVYLDGGRTRTTVTVLAWAEQAVSFGAGEILFTSMNHDGVKEGFAIEMLSRLGDTLPVPVIASGGAGKMEHFREVFKQTNVYAALAASIFHFREIEISQLKEYLFNHQIPIRNECSPC